MTKRNKVLFAALLAALPVAFAVLGQTTGTQARVAAGTRSDRWSKVAAVLGITTDAPVAPFQQAEVQTIGEALAAGTVTDEQAAALKAGIEAPNAMQAVLEQAVAAGKIAQERLSLLGVRPGPGPLGRCGFAPDGTGGGGPGCHGR